MTTPRTSAWVFRFVVAVLPLVAIVAVWHFADLRSLDSAHAVGKHVRAVGEGPLGFIYVPAGFAVGSLLFVPVTALIGGVALAFEPVRGFCYAMAGGLLGAALAYGVGYLMGGSMVDALSGPRMTKFKAQVRTHAFRSALIVHLLPFGSFTAVNLLGGSLRMPFGAFMLGTGLGLLPGVVFFTLLAGRVPDVVREPTALNIAVLVLGVAAVIGLAWWLRRWAKRHEHGDAAA